MSKNTENLKALTHQLPDIGAVTRTVFSHFWAEEFHSNSRCELIYIVSGKMTLRFADGKNFDASKGDVLIVPPKISHRDDFSANESPEIFYCSFNWRHINSYTALVDNRALKAISPPTRREIRRLFENISLDLLSGGEFDRIVTASRILTILMVLLRDVAISASDPKTSTTHMRHEEIFEQAKSFIAANFNKTISIDDIADAINISPYYLSHIFSAASNLSIYEYITELRMHKAAELLSDGGMNIAQIAKTVGYNNPNYFSCAFSRFYGLSPSKYRRKAR